MATVTKRQIRATPQRTASEAWQIITDLIAPDKDSPARADLSRVAGVLGQIIATEVARDTPIVVFGNGPRLRIYCLYNEDAITGEDANENKLAFTPTEGDWRISVPVLADDLEWVQHELKARSTRISAREKGEPIDEDGYRATSSASVQVDVKAFLRS